MGFLLSGAAMISGLARRVSNDSRLPAAGRSYFKLRTNLQLPVAKATRKRRVLGIEGIEICII